MREGYIPLPDPKTQSQSEIGKDNPPTCRPRDRRIIEQKAVEGAVAAVKEAAESGNKFCVLRVNVGLDAKALAEALAQAQKAQADIPLMLLSTDDVKDKLMVYSGCDKGSVKDSFDAGKWAKDALTACGGKGGGKPTSATGQAPGAGNLDTALEAANAFAAMNLA